MTERQKIQRLFKELLKAPKKRFPLVPANLDAPAQPGVYIIYDAANKVCHVGCTYRGKRGLYQRLRNHMQTQSSFTIAKPKWHGKKLRGRFTYRCLPVHQARARAFLESLAIGTLCPEHIGSHQTRVES